MGITARLKFTIILQRIQKIKTWPAALNRSTDGPTPTFEELKNSFLANSLKSIVLTSRDELPLQVATLMVLDKEKGS